MELEGSTLFLVGFPEATIEALLPRPPQALSRGQRLRVALGAALTTEPELLILDEPTSGQDPDAMRSIVDALAERPAGMAVLLATHDRDLVRACAHRVLSVEEGRIAGGPAGGR